MPIDTRGENPLESGEIFLHFARTSLHICRSEWVPLADVITGTIFF